jgi:hypothetical protein
MSFLAPLFFLGLGAIAVPVIVHLIQRERKHVVQFPSLMFIRRIPYQSVRRRRIRHWYLLLMRAAAMALLVAAFARPFLKTDAAAVGLGGGGSREVVIALDRSASMGYGDHWDRAKAAASDAIRNLGATDRASLVLFGSSAEEQIHSTSDRGRLQLALDAAQVTSGATRYGPAMKLVESILAQSTLPRREVILISDFQRTGWSSGEDASFPEQTEVTPIAITSDPTTNIAIPSLTSSRAAFSGQERITVTVGVNNRSPRPAENVPVTLEIDGHQLESKPVSIGAGASASVSFAEFTLSNAAVRGTVRAGTDPLAADNAFHFVIAPGRPLSVLVVAGDTGEGGDSTFYLSKALAIGKNPSYQVEIVPAARVNTEALAKHTVVILNDSPVPPAVGVSGLRAFVERGGGLLVAVGERTMWPTTEGDLLPGTLGAPVDRMKGRGGALGFLDRSHPVFEVFKAPRSGDFSAARVFRYRPIEPAANDRVLARFDDGLVAAAERQIGTGRVVALATTLDDSWNDLARKPVYLPLVHQLVRYLARYEQPSSWSTVGQVVDLSALLKSRAERVVVTPASEQIKVPATEAGLLELNEQGIYEVRATAGSAAPSRIAVNIDPAESDLTPLDPSELVAAVTGQARQAGAAPTDAAEVTPEDSERQQGIWWYLLVAGMLLLAAEMVIANRLSQNERFL